MKKAPIRSTVLFRVYYYEKSSSPGLEEGTIWMTDERHKLTPNSELHFDSFDRIPALIRRLLKTKPKK